MGTLTAHRPCPRLASSVQSLPDIWPSKQGIQASPGWQRAGSQGPDAGSLCVGRRLTALLAVSPSPRHRAGRPLPPRVHTRSPGATHAQAIHTEAPSGAQMRAWRLSPHRGALTGSFCGLGRGRERLHGLWTERDNAHMLLEPPPLPELAGRGRGCGPPADRPMPRICRRPGHLRSPACPCCHRPPWAPSVRASSVAEKYRLTPSCS